jgi:hypothetical protein
MSENKGNANTQSEPSTLDLIELWKRLTMQNEEAWGQAVKEFLGTKTFNHMAGAMRDQYLAQYQSGKQGMERLLEMEFFPSKKDLAAVSEMMIALEDKVDQIDFQIHHNLTQITDNLLKIAEFQHHTWEQVLLIKQELDEISATLQLGKTEPESINDKKTASKKKSKPRESD